MEIRWRIIKAGFDLCATSIGGWRTLEGRAADQENKLVRSLSLGAGQRRYEMRFQRLGPVR